MFSIIKPRGDIKTNWESVNPVLRLREWGVEWEETVGTGDIKVKIGDGVKHWNELDYAIVNDVTKKIVKTFAEVNSDDNPNPILNPGESIDALFGKIKQKFEYATNFMTSLKNMVGDYQARSFNTGSGTVTADDLKSAIDILEQYKLTTANILDVNDSTNTFAALSANQGRLINEKAVANANAISTLNSNLENTNKTLTGTTNIVNTINRFYKSSGIPYIGVGETIRDVGDIFNKIGKNGVCGIDAGVASPFLPEKHYYVVYVNTYGAVTIFLAMAPEASYIASMINEYWSGWSKFTLTKL